MTFRKESRVNHFFCTYSPNFQLQTLKFEYDSKQGFHFKKLQQVWCRFQVYLMFSSKQSRNGTMKGITKPLDSERKRFRHWKKEQISQNDSFAPTSSFHSFYTSFNQHTRFFINVIHVFFINNSFIKNARLKLAKNQAVAKQHPEAEFLLFENYSLSSSTLSSSTLTYSKKMCEIASVSILMRLGAGQI